MSWAKVLGCIVLVVLMAACSWGSRPEVAATGTPGAGVTLVEPTAQPPPGPTKPLPASILNDGCPVTEANGATPPGEDYGASHHGNGLLWTSFYPESTVVFEPNGPGGRDPLDGSLSMKFWWWRGVEGKLEITGRRLDAEAPPMSASIPDGYGDTGFQATSLIFPTEGCWEVTGRAGDATLIFVTRVVDNYPPFEPAPRVALEDCPTTPPNGSTPPGEAPDNAYYGNGELWTVLWPDGTVVFEPEGPGTRDLDGSLRMKWPFWRAVSGDLDVHGLRLDEPAPAVRPMILDGYGDTGFQSTVLVFPAPGCWEISVQAAGSELTFVTLVESRY